MAEPRALVDQIELADVVVINKVEDVAGAERDRGATLLAAQLPAARDGDPGRAGGGGAFKLALHGAMDELTEPELMHAWADSAAAS